MTSKNIIVLSLLSLFLVSSGCEERFPLQQLPDPLSQVVVGDTNYVEIVPPIEGFNQPASLLIGLDQLLYVADTKNNRVVMMNLAGQMLGTRAVLQPTSLMEDFRLDLLVGGVIVAANGDSVGAIFRVKLAPAQHAFATARIDTVWREPARPRRRFVGIALLPDNRYLVVRRGPDNSSFVDPDCRVLMFSATDQFITPLGDLVTQAGSGITNINQPTGITTFPNSRDFIVIQSSEGIAYGAIWMVFQQSSDFEGWLPKYDPAKPDDRFVDFVRPNRFINPLAVAIDGSRRDMFIIDAAQDSVFKFDNRGRFRGESFGLSRTSGRMKRPSGAAFFDKTLYISDAETNRIFRFKLSTDFQ